MKMKLVHICSSLTFAALILGVILAVNSAARLVFSTPVATSEVTPVQTIETPPAAEVKRYPTVEAYFGHANPNPLSYRKGEPLFERDVSERRKRAVKERDGNCCLVCGSTVQLEVDHRIALMNGGNNSDENLGTLCDACHVEKTRYDWAIKRRRRKEAKIRK